MRFLPIYSIGALMILLVASGCSKDNDGDGPDNIIGSWTVDGGTAVATTGGAEVYNGDLTASGTFVFNQDSTGTVDMMLAFENSTSTLRGDFAWIKGGNNIILNEGTANELRLQRTRNERDTQELAFSQEDSGTIVEFKIVLRRQ